MNWKLHPTRFEFCCLSILMFLRVQYSPSVNMALLNLLKVFTIFTFLFPSLGKNVAPPAVRQRSSQDTPRNLPQNKAPSMNVSGRSSRPEQVDSKSLENAPLSVPQDHVFYDSYQANFSWSNPVLQTALGIRPASLELNKREGHLVHRAPGGQLIDPIFKLPSCLGCIEASNGQTMTLEELTTEYLENQIILRPDSVLQDRCVFYTSVPNPATAATKLSAADLTEYFNRVNLGGADRHPGLSLKATSWACSNKKVTIWNFFSGANDVSGGRDIPSKRNYWEVYVEGSWLNFLTKDDQQFVYFERMSKAMALHCGGVIYVMSMRPEEMPKYKFIWGTVEYPTLLARFTGALGGAPTKLISIDAANPNKQYVLDWHTQQSMKSLTRTDPDFLEVNESALHGRDTCTSNVDYEPPDEDWFG
ncbi:hypothetical protein F4781DRAFT_416265 [Annulohypoxylon bovei var. microspora]|nr:hypothetical protein F4781DRAFT_416265 [Annulohypoxylon bovei var. microspora]